VSSPTLNESKPKVWRRISSLRTDGGPSTEGLEERVKRLTDLGFVPDERVCVLRRSWWKGGALVVQVGNATFALRDSEAACIELVP
jgi:ferrous iron transport protein A